MNTLFNYFKLNDGLPNLRGPLSSIIGSQPISSANREVVKRSWHDRKHPEKHVLRTTGVKLMNVAYRYFVVIPLSTLGILHLNVLKLGSMPVSMECQLQLKYIRESCKSISVKQQYVPSGMRSAKNPLSEDI